MYLNSNVLPSLWYATWTPDNAAFDEIVDRLYVLHKIRLGMQDAEAGRGISSDEFAREIEQW